MTNGCGNNLGSRRTIGYINPRSSALRRGHVGGCSGVQPGVLSSTPASGCGD